MSELRAYLAQASRKPWIWGGHDCCTFAADWALRWGAGDPMARWRGTYTTEAETAALIDLAGGIEHLWYTGLTAIDATPRATPLPGDVGVIWVRGTNGPEKIGGIFVGPRWSALAPSGVLIAHAECVAAWGPPRG